MHNLKKSNFKYNRINSDIEKALSSIIRSEIKDPRVGLMTSIVKTETTSDLKFCKIYVSVLGTEDEKQATITALKNASGFIRYKLAHAIDIRNTPELQFILDESIEYGAMMSKRIEEVIKQDSMGGNADDQ